MESRPISETGGRYLSARSRVCGGPGTGLKCPVDADNALNSHRLGPGNTNQRRLGSTRYSTLPVYPSTHHPGYAHPWVMHRTHGLRDTGNMHI